MNKKMWAALGITVLMMAVGFYLLPTAPAKMPVHWNAAGEVDRYGSPAEGLFLLPVAMLFMFLLFYAIPFIDPFKKNIQQFIKYYYNLVLILSLFMAGIQAMILAASYGYGDHTTVFIVPAVAILLYYIGMIMPKFKRNFFIGIRTPWTLTDDKVWKKTHEIGGKLFKLCGVVVFLSIFLPSQYMVIVILGAVLPVALGLVVYSYWLHAKKNK